jgi:hypothetical protein
MQRHNELPALQQFPCNFCLSMLWFNTAGLCTKYLASRATSTPQERLCTGQIGLDNFRVVGILPTAISSSMSQSIQELSSRNPTSRRFCECWRCTWLLRRTWTWPENFVAPSPDVCILRTISFMERWRILSKEQAQLWIGSVIHKLRCRLSLLSSDAGDGV